MRCSKPGNLFAAAALAAIFALGLQAVRAQYTSGSSSTDSGSTENNAAAGRTSTGSSGPSRGSTSWTAGADSFRGQKTLPKETWGTGRTGASKDASSWTAGKSSFSSSNQTGGVWVEGSTPATTAPKTPPHELSAHTPQPNRSPALVGMKPAAPGNRTAGAPSKTHATRAAGVQLHTGPGSVTTHHPGTLKFTARKAPKPSFKGHPASEKGGTADKKTGAMFGQSSMTEGEPSPK